jgi:hypothetical protein
MINKIKCMLFGHKESIAQCPYTKATIVSCHRCGMGNNNAHGTMSFK